MFPHPSDSSLLTASLLAAVFVSSRKALCDETKTAARETSSLVKEENTTS